MPSACDHYSYGRTYTPAHNFFTVISCCVMRSRAQYSFPLAPINVEVFFLCFYNVEFSRNCSERSWFSSDALSKLILLTIRSQHASADNSDRDGYRCETSEGFAICIISLSHASLLQVIALLCLIVAGILQIVAVLTTFWLKSGPSRFGLFEECTAATGTADAFGARVQGGPPPGECQPSSYDRSKLAFSGRLFASEHLCFSSKSGFRDRIRFLRSV